jgi:hypothetical protein
MSRSRQSVRQSVGRWGRVESSNKSEDQHSEAVARRPANASGILQKTIAARSLGAAQIYPALPAASILRLVPLHQGNVIDPSDCVDGDRGAWKCRRDGRTISRSSGAHPPRDCAGNGVRLRGRQRGVRRSRFMLEAHKAQRRDAGFRRVAGPSSRRARRRRLPELQQVRSAGARAPFSPQTLDTAAG